MMLATAIAVLMFASHNATCVEYDDVSYSHPKYAMEGREVDVVGRFKFLCLSEPPE